eukprot:TRINITY_DN20285_c0_g1_i1.p1 TRINITY_DN20285_c0_g1~~TRINITY_DN20285_c0_g1_i1.p1  ORF type:complete len:190 (+),score=16.00 TRINITY_DN20285_c0_g1_i1:219-788(+)
MPYIPLWYCRLTYIPKYTANSPPAYFSTDNNETQEFCFHAGSISPFLLLYFQDNAPAHKSQVLLTSPTQEYLKGLKSSVLDWLPFSPDLNPIETLWGVLKKKLRGPRGTSKVSRPKRSASLLHCAEWLKLGETRAKLIQGMPARIQAVLDSRRSNWPVVQYSALTIDRLNLATSTARMSKVFPFFFFFF